MRIQKAHFVLGALLGLLFIGPGPSGSAVAAGSGGLIAFVRDGQIYVMNADGNGERRLTRNGSSSPSWSPDGRTIAFDAGADIYVMNADGSRQRSLTRNSNENEGDPSWSPDGRRIAFRSTGDSTYPQIYVMNADGSGRRRLTRNSMFDDEPCWSPDGRRIAFVRRRSISHQPASGD